MNLFKVIYARCFQGMMFIAEKFMNIRKPVVFKNVLDCHLILKQEGKCNALIVSDKNIKEFGLLNALEESLLSHGLKFNEYLDVQPNPTFKNILDGKDIYLKNNCDCIIAVGGGSVMDCAKVIGALIVNPKKSIPQLKGLLKVRRDIPLMLAVPTTCGTGSEATLAAVVRNEETLEKYSINDPHLIPKYAFLEAEMIKNLPNKILTTTAMDAITHALEAYIGLSTTKETRSFSEKALLLISQNIEKAFENKDDLEAKANLLEGSFYSGMAFTRSYVGYVHAVAHACGALYNLPHGYLCAIILPVFLQRYKLSIANKLNHLAHLINLPNLSEDNEMINAQIFIDYIVTLNEKFSIPKKIEQLKKDSEDVKKIAKKAYKESMPLYPVPVLLTEDELVKIINEELATDENKQ